MSDRTAMTLAFTESLGAFVTEGLRGLRGEKAVLVNLAHERGEGSLRIVVDTSPVAITVYLLPMDEMQQPVELFSVHDLPTGKFQ